MAAGGYRIIRLREGDEVQDRRLADSSCSAGTGLSDQRAAWLHESVSAELQQRVAPADSAVVRTIGPGVDADLRCRSWIVVSSR